MTTATMPSLMISSMSAVNGFAVNVGRQRRKYLVNEIITLKQPPIIEERLKAISEKIDEDIALADSMVCSEESVKRVRSMRADLRKQYEQLEEQRKQIKKAIMAPYEEIEVTYKRYVGDKFEAADNKLNCKIASVESGLKKAKEDEGKAYFWEYLESKNIDFVEFESVGLNITLSATKKALKTQAKEFVDEVCGGLALIETQEYKDEILVEFKKTLSAAQAITAVMERHKAIENEKERQEKLRERRAAEAEAAKRVSASTPASPPPVAPPVAAPVPKTEESDPVLSIAFTATARKSELIRLREYMDKEGIKYV